MAAEPKWSAKAIVVKSRILIYVYVTGVIFIKRDVITSIFLRKKKPGSEDKLLKKGHARRRSCKMIGC